MANFLRDIPLAQAQALFRTALADAGLAEILGTEIIPCDENALFRVLAEPVWARISSPHYHASAMDGFALRADSTAGASPTAPVELESGMFAAYVDTGDPLPEWANAVVPIEQVELLGQDGLPTTNLVEPWKIIIRAGVTPWSYVRPMGEDMVATQMVLPAGHELRPVDLGAVAAAGCSEVHVAIKPSVGIIPTGTELVPSGTEPKKGEIIEFNSIVLAAQVRSWGGNPSRLPIVPDDFPLLAQQVQKAADENDLVLLIAGSSAGSEDYSSRIVETLGRLLVHGVAIRPGHPVILGMLKRSPSAQSPARSVPVIGIPGYPVSAALTGEIFIEPLVAQWLGRFPHEPLEVKATLTRKLNSPSGDDDYVRMVVGRVGEKLLAAPLARGAGVISSLVKADGITILKSGVQGLDAGAEVSVRLYRSPQDLERTIFMIGSHDMTLDVLAQHLVPYHRRLVSANVGSQGGLVALRRGESHLAGSHLLDPESGEYNVSFVKSYLPDCPVRVITWAGRDQGLIVRPGNPLQLSSLADLDRPGVRFINRQRGAGTRVLLDYHLKKLGISPGNIEGYENEEYTHLAVSAAVASGRADCGLGVAAAAAALNLQFIPLFHERYDLIIPMEYVNSDLLAPIFTLMHNRELQKEIARFPGYDVSKMGTVIL